MDKMTVIDAEKYIQKKQSRVLELGFKKTGFYQGFRVKL